jgi:subtilisin family serine protease
MLPGTTETLLCSGPSNVKLLYKSTRSPMLPPVQFTTQIVALGGYQDFSGTSAATPEAAGCVALLKQRFPREYHVWRHPVG